MKSVLSCALAAGFGMLLAGAVHAADGPLIKQGGMMVDAKGMTVYTFDNDKAGKSMCNDACAKAWPPVMAASGAKPMGDMTIITRDDNSKQWAYKGKPVYTYVKDTKTGEATGDKFKEVWHVVKP